MHIAIALHLLAAVVWVGGMFFAYMALRPAAGKLAPALRLELWQNVFDRFFRFVWIAIILLLATGYWMIFRVFGGMAGAGIHIHLMQTIGIVMMLIYMHVYFAPYRRLRKALAAGDQAAAEKKLGQIRKLVALNLTLGILTLIIASSGHYW